VAPRKSNRSTSGQRDMFGEAMALASTLAEGRKHAAAERITELATAARDVTTTFHDLPFLRDYTEAAADRLDELAVYVDDTELPEIINDIATFARRQPMATLALTVAAGFVTSQLVRDWPSNGSNGSGASSRGRSTARKGGRRRRGSR
jgi:hypothetical protein